ncbi:glycosyltransferase family 4 protein [Oryzobacter terrae]|uniref:glycosyltransferase family 4 protein n=1 Tax=Oryzobacter terrae TaxID=1620385 RepID=UPI00367123B9
MAGLSLVKVAMLTDCYPPRLGGIESQVRDLSRHLVEAGHDVEVFTATTGPDGERGGATTVGDDGVTVHRLAIALPFGVPVNPFARSEVRRRLAAGGFDVAHAHLGVVSPFATDLVPLALDLGLPVTATFHCVIDRSRPVFRAVGHLARWARRGVALGAVSSMAAARVSDAARGARVEVVPNGVDVAWWRTGAAGDAGAAAGVADDGTAVGGGARSGGAVHVVTATRLASRKRPLALLGALRAARGLLDPAVPLRATVVGEGPQRRVLERYVRTHGLDWVELPGRVDREALRRLHHSADAYLTATRLEAFGIAALEARAAGLPVVALRGTGTDDFVRDGVEGLLADDDAGLAAALARLAGDDGLRERLRQHVRAVPPAQDWDGVLEATLAQYHRAGVPVR